MPKTPPTAAPFAATNRLQPAPDANRHPMEPTPAAPSDGGEGGVPAGADPAKKLTQFSARMDPELLRRIKIAAAVRGINLQNAASEAFEDWVSKQASPS